MATETTSRMERAGASCPIGAAPREAASSDRSWKSTRETAKKTAAVLGVLALAAAAGTFFYFEAELRRYLRMRRM
jgi:hypothetical protein